LVGKTSGNGDGPTTCLYLLIYSILQPWWYRRMSSETSATQLTSTRCQHPKAGSTSIMNHHESLKSV
jgi:hypothetical protein